MTNNLKTQKPINYDMCLWKHGREVEMSPRGVIYKCNKCEPNAFQASGQKKQPVKNRNRRSRIRQTSELVK